MEEGLKVFYQTGEPNQKGMVPLGFQKNYPKNIFIPIIEHLSDLGLKKKYQDCVGTRQLFEGKNVVSLSVIHQLITQPWFEENVDRMILLAVVCNKILVNSKIKKKIFHLKVAQVIISCSISNEKQFRHVISKKIALLASSKIQNDEFLSFPNLTLYLFHLLATSLASTLRIPQNFEQMLKLTSQHKPEDEQQSHSSHSKAHLSSKQEFRLYLKLIIKIFNDQTCKLNRFIEALKNFQIYLEQKQFQFSEKYELPDSIMNWNLFKIEVTDRCLQYKRSGIKLTNIILNEWIDKFKERCLIFKPDYKRIEKNHTQQFTDHEDKSTTCSGVFCHNSRDFCPIIIQTPSQLFSNEDQICIKIENSP